MAKTFTVSRKSHYPSQKPHCKVEWYKYLLGATSFKDLQILSLSLIYMKEPWSAKLIQWSVV